MTVQTDQAGSRPRRSTGHLRLAGVSAYRQSRHTVPDGRAMEHLPRAECLRLMGSVPVGRIIYSQWAMPAVAVVNFAMAGDESIVIRTGASGKLWSAIRRAVVAFETDRVDKATRSGWSVTVVGRAEEVTDASEVTKLRKLDLHPWAPGEREHFIRIRPEIVTGRRIRPAAALPAPGFHATVAGAVGTSPVRYR